MSSRSYADYVSDILTAVGYIEADTEGFDLESFRADRKARQLTERNLEIISEASRRLPDSLKAQASDIPWDKIAGIGNVLRHDYFNVAMEVLWSICQDDLPPLKAAMRRMQRQLQQS